MNDPNGLIRIGDEYHLFYQHNPDEPIHRNMHWGHAISRDLSQWHHQPIALDPDPLGQIFSGSAVVDHDDTAGFGPGALVAVFTHAGDGGQQQSIAHSSDRVRFNKFAGNPVIGAPPGLKDFRDPKVIRWQSEAGPSWWTMVVAADKELWFFTSDDLKSWTKSSALDLEVPAPKGVLEVPDIVRVPIAGTGEHAWVMFVSTLVRDTNGSTLGSRVLWVPGSFDGKQFSPDGELRTVDRGQNFYAAMAWSEGPADQPVLIGWMDENSGIASRPSDDWCGRMSLPRKLTLHRSTSGFQLLQSPIIGSAQLSTKEAAEVDVGATASIELVDSLGCIAIDSGASDFEVDIAWGRGEGERFRLVAHEDRIEVVAESNQARHKVDLSSAATGRLEALWVVDAGSVEVFIGEGRRAASWIIGDAGPVTAVVHNHGAEPIQTFIQRGA